MMNTFDPAHDAYQKNKSKFAQATSELREDHDAIKKVGRFLVQYADLDSTILNDRENPSCAGVLSDEALQQAEEVVKAIRRIKQNIGKKEELGREIAYYEDVINPAPRQLDITDADEKAREVYEHEYANGADLRI